MEVLDATTLQRGSARDRAAVEREAQAGLTESAHARFRSEEEKKPLVYRMTVAKRRQLVRLADMLSVGKTGRNKASLTDTLDEALDALEEKLTAADQ